MYYIYIFDMNYHQINIWIRKIRYFKHSMFNFLPRVIHRQTDRKHADTISALSWFSFGFWSLCISRVLCTFVCVFETFCKYNTHCVFTHTYKLQPKHYEHFAQNYIEQRYLKQFSKFLHCVWSKFINYKQVLSIFS